MYVLKNLKTPIYLLAFALLFSFSPAYSSPPKIFILQVIELLDQGRWRNPADVFPTLSAHYPVINQANVFEVTVLWKLWIKKM